MSYVLDFYLKGLPKTTNSGNRSHWAVKVKEANSWKTAVWAETRSKRPPAPLTKAKVTLVRFSAVSPDYDGLVSSFKHVLDGLVEAGILIDDKADVIGVPNYQWEKVSPKNGRIWVRVEEA